MLTGFALSGLCACSARGAKSLYVEAAAKHGACEIVSKEESDDFTKVVLHDELQDFDYEVISGMDDIDFDGANFGSIEGTKDNFMSGLKKKVVSDIKADLDKTCEGMHFETYYDSSDDRIIGISSANADDCQKAALACAKLVQEQNQKGRLDGLQIVADGDAEHYGSVKLPDITWRDADAENADHYTMIARDIIDSDVTFIRLEKKTFADTGADLDRVVNMFGEEYPTSPDSPVIFYYFKASDGNEYYLCNFNYYSEDHGSFRTFTDYTGTTPIH